MSLNFNGTSDTIKFAVGTSTGFQGGTYSLACMLKRRVGSLDANHPTFLSTYTSGGTLVLEWGVNPGSALWNGSAANSGPRTIADTSGWVLAGAQKVTGTNTPRFHTYYVSTTTQYHDNGSSTHANSANSMGSSGFFTVGSANGGDYFDGDIAWVATFEGVSLTDANYNSMVAGLDAVYALNPTHLWIFDQAPASVIDTMNKGASYVSVSGTTTGSAPPAGHQSLWNGGYWGTKSA